MQKKNSNGILKNTKRRQESGNQGTRTKGEYKENK